MAYATRDDLAQALRVRVTADNSDLLDACLEAAADEIDAYLDRPSTSPLPTPAPFVVVRANVNRAVEWFKATDAANGQVGLAETGKIPTQPGDGFARHGWTILGEKAQWGLS